ncbi:MAG: DUF378 domain-containing protein [Candidatus Niyogibacteria bacterium]|nr:MAG: DUF378 domain-containing protein [Candidatus Niyogibacteria bacterium]
MKILHKIAFLLLVVGGLNWAALALFNWEIGSLFGGQTAAVSKFIYVLVGLSALYEIFGHNKNCKSCSTYPTA